MEGKRPRAVIYARISLDRKEELGIKRQLEAAKRLAKLHECEVADEFSDNSISAYSGARRPGYNQLCRAIEEGRCDRVYVYSADRLTRRTRDLLDYLDLCTKPGTIVTTHAVTG